MTGSPEAKLPRFSISTDSSGNELAVSVTAETAFFDLQSQSGSGSATIELVSGAPPQNLLLRLHLAGLEQFRLSFDGTVVTASVASSDIGNITESVISTGGAEQSISPDSPLWLDMRVVSDENQPHIPLDRGYFEITLPKDFLVEGRRSFSIRWLDFYR